ncbi:MAG: hypothetical protein EPO64_04230, partial [Nitrospirae bacterium]
MTNATLIAFCLACLALAMGVFVVPFRIAPPQGVVSASAIAGYNNTAAYAIYLVLLAVAGLAAARLLLAGRMDLDLTLPRIRYGPSRVVLVVMAGHLALFAGLYLVKGYFVFGDAMYFQQVLARMVDGAVPYRDINFFYGPAMLYPPYWLSRVLSVTTAYAVYYAAMYLAGLYLLYLAVKLSVGDSRADGVFILCSLGFFNHTLGLNYVFVRGLLPAAAVIGLWLYLERPTVGRLAGAAGLLFCTLVYSSEMGILAALAGLLLAALRIGLPLLADRLPLLGLEVRRANIRSGVPSAGGYEYGWDLTKAGLTLGRALLVCLLALSGLIASFYLMDSSFQALTAFVKPMVNQVGGAGNRPIYFNLPILAVMAASVLVLGATLASARGRLGASATALVLALATLAIMMQRMAFGVPDSLHVVNNCLPLFLLGLFLAARVRPGGGSVKWYGVLLLLAVMLPLQVFNAFMFKPYLERKLGVTAAADISVSPAPTSREVQASLDRILAGFGPNHTYYLYALQYYSLPMVLRWHLKQVPYFTILEEAQMPKDFQ